MPKLYITDTTLRDAHQSLLATRMRTEDMLPIAEKIDAVGFWSVEVWGGATFDSTLRFLKEDPWERLRSLKKVMPKTPFQMLLRGQNLVGYRHYADDVVERFVEKAVENGVDILRIFDALNDLRNIKTAVKATLRAGGKVEGTVCYTTGPIYHNDVFVDMARKLEDMGCDTICIKDMAGLIAPYDAYDLVLKMKKAIRVPIHLHCHETSGMATSAYLKAAEAGVDIIDCAISAVASGTSQPPIETLVNSVKGTPLDTGLDLTQLAEIAVYFREVRKKYHEYESEFTGVDPNVLIFQVPGGMISNLASQLKEQNALDRMKEVLDEVPRVREDFGYPPLVTPSSQIVGTQATLNVLTGERYKVITSETRNYFKGLYGKPPAPVNEEARKKAIGDEEFIECRPADTLAPEWEKAAKEVEHLAKSEEDILSYILFPKPALEFFELREKGELPTELPSLHKDEAAAVQASPHLAPSEFNIQVHGEMYHVKIGGTGHKGNGKRPYFIYVDGQLEEVLVESLVEVVPSEVGQIERGAGGHSRRPKAMEEGDVTAPMPGTVISLKVKKGSQVQAGDTVLVVEAMKMENEVHTPVAGTVKEIHVKEGDSVNPDEVLVVIR
ncbi:MAG: sodium-extruding oxaloacetate decarboxylase subunit alpha [Nitrospirota bacterium]|nr:sodium-extruding oxaloacetate decarboxylase subunit alpha [Nitrospirota bacterium]